MVYVSTWLHMNVLSLDAERVIIQRGEEPLKRLLTNRLGLKTIEVDMLNAYPLGGAFHCWTLDIRRRGTLEKYLSILTTSTVNNLSISAPARSLLFFVVDSACLSVRHSVCLFVTLLQIVSFFCLSMESGNLLAVNSPRGTP